MHKGNLSLSIFHICMVHLFAISCYVSVLGNDDSLNPSAVLSVNTNDEKREVETKPIDDLAIDSKISEGGPVEMFQPTHEWQVIKPGQSIPPGLHIRMDFQTGIKEAKFLDPEDDNSSAGSSLQVVREEGEENGEVEESVDMETEKMKYLKDYNRDESEINFGERRVSKDDLKNALKNFKSGMDDVKNKEEAEKLQEKYRSYEELKQDFKAMNVKVETDTEIMQRLVDQFKEEGASLEQKINVLHDLEYYVHQIDNAQNLESINGFKMLVKGLNDTEPEMKEACAFVLGSAFQSNPKVQIQGIEEGAMTLLLRMMHFDQSFNVQKKALYALSSLIRHFPYAQRKFVSLGGVTSLSQVLQRESSAMLPLQIRAVSLFNDLVVEHNSAQETVDNDPSDTVARQRLEQYNQFNIMYVRVFLY
ncbi:nucleotide exchange factor SIL1-like isoform X2 [Antedon mediterranea]|uniref:nucleotide exchange factor SIL1-like isoform X2 n=1 Tax=Antedon mediterranea TaxID=105859 RepID=UPI003AF5559D